MKYAIFSDIHGNLEALEAVLGHASEAGVDRYLCLGDVVGYGANPEECVQRIRELPDIVVLRGNHDAATVDRNERVFFHEVALEGIEYTVKHLTEESMAFLSTLPFEYLENNVFMGVHASPFNPASWEYVLDQAGAQRAFGVMRHQAAFIGHSHTPIVFNDEGFGRRFSPEEPIEIKGTTRFIINVGSVGQPRDGNPDAAYTIFDEKTRTATLVRLRYEREKAAEKILQAGLAPVLAERLLVGY